MAIRGRLVQQEPGAWAKEQHLGERARIKMEGGADRLTDFPEMALLTAVVERAWNDVKGVAMSGVRKTQRDIIQAEAAEFLAWAQQEATSDEHLPEW